jgi:hypothetical protein
MGNIYRNFGGSGSGGTTPNPLEAYYGQLIALAQNINAIMSLATNSTPILNVSMTLSGCYSAIGQLFNVPATYSNSPLSSTWAFMREWLWGKGRSDWFGFTDTFANNQTLIVPTQVLNGDGSAGAQVIISLEMKIDETFVPTEGFVTVDLSTATTIAEKVQAITNALSSSGYGTWAINTPSHYLDERIFIQRAACSTDQNGASYDITGTTPFTVTQTEYALASVSSIFPSTGIIRDLGQALPGAIVEVPNNFNPSTDVLTDTSLQSVIDGKVVLWTPGTLISKTNKSKRYQLRFIGDTDGNIRSKVQMHPLRSVQAHWLSQGVTPISQASEYLDPDGVGGVGGVGDVFGPFSLHVSGYTKCDTAVRFEVILNGHRLRGGNNVSGSARSVTNTSMGILTGAAMPTGTNGGIVLTGDKFHNNSNQNADYEMPFDITLEFPNPRFSEATLHGRRLIHAVCHYTIDRYSGAPDTTTTTEAWFWDYNPNDIVVGSIHSAGIISMVYNTGSGNMEETPVMYDTKISLNFNS